MKSVVERVKGRRRPTPAQTSVLAMRQQPPLERFYFNRHGAPPHLRAIILLLLLVYHFANGAPTQREYSSELISSQKNGYYAIGNATLRDDFKDTFFQLQSSPIKLGQLVEAPNELNSKKTTKKPGRRKQRIRYGNKAMSSIPLYHGECTSTPFKQKVKSAGCLPKAVINKMCHGRCHSFFVPRLTPKKLKARFWSSSTCAPTDYDIVDVVLDCPGQEPPQQIKQVMKVNKCSCVNVKLNEDS